MIHGRFKYATLAVLVVIGALIAWYWVDYGNPFRKPLLEKGDKMISYLEDAAEAVKQEEWEVAQAAATEAQARFNAVTAKLQYAADKSEYDMFKQGLVRLKAAIDIRDRSEAYMQARELLSQWKDMANP